MNTAQLKQYFRQFFKVVIGGPASGPNGKTRSSGILSALDKLAEESERAFEPLTNGELDADKQALANLQLRPLLLELANGGAGTTPPTQAATPTAFAVSGTPTQTSVSLGWAGPSGATYVLQRATNSAFSAGLVTVYTGTNTSVTNSSGLSAGTTYYYRVKAQVAGLADSAFATLSVDTAAAPTTGSIVAMGGASNIQGTGSMRAVYDPSTPYQGGVGSPIYNNTFMKVGNALITIHTDANALARLTFDDQNPANTASTSPANNKGAYYYTHGMEAGIAPAFLTAFPGQPLTFFKDGHGGQGIAKWSPSLSAANGGFYEGVRDGLLNTRQLVAGQGLTPHVDGFVWSQGENDTGNTGWAAAFATFINQLRADGALDSDTKIILMRIDDPTMMAQQDSYVNGNPNASIIECGNWARASDDLHIIGEAHYVGGYRVANRIWNLALADPFAMPQRTGTVQPPDPTAAPAGTDIIALNSPYVTLSGASFSATPTPVAPYAYDGSVDFLPPGDSATLSFRGYAGGWALYCPTFNGYPSKCYVSVNGGAETALTLGGTDANSHEVYRVAGLDANLVSTFRIRYDAADNLQGVFDIVRCLAAGATMSVPAPLAEAAAPSSQLLANSEFSSSLAGWDNNGAAGVYASTNGVLVVNNGGGSYFWQPLANMAHSFVDGQNYTLDIKINALGGGIIAVTDDGSSVNHLFDQAGTFSFPFTYAAGAGKLSLRFFGNNEVDYCRINPA